MKQSIIICTVLAFLLFPAGIYSQCLLNTLSNSEAGTGFGEWLAIDGDMDGDGINDIAVEGKDPEKVYIYSGRTYELMYTFEVDLYHSNLTPNITLGGDANNDGYDDLVVGTPRAASGKVKVFSGRTGSLLYKLGGDDQYSELGNVVGYVGDINDDGHDDIIALDFINEAVVFSGADGSVLYQYENSINHTLWGILAGGMGDVDNDGYGDFFISDAGTIPDQMYGWLYVFSGKTGDTLHTFMGSRDDETLGYAATGPGDVDHDGYDEILVATHGKVLLFSGATGDTMQVLPYRTRSLFRAGDVDNDGTVDIGMLRDDMGSDDKVAVYSGETFNLIFEAVGNNPAGGDMHDDGYAEIIFKAPTAEGDTLSEVKLYSFGDSDCDGYVDVIDICPDDYNPDQEDHDGDGIGDSCDTCDEVEFKLGTAIIFIEGTTVDGVSETAHIPFQLKITSWLEDCYPSDTIDAIELRAKYDHNRIAFDSARIGDGTWNGEITCDVIRGDDYSTVDISLSGGSMVIPEELTTCFYLDFKALCQHSITENIIDITTSSQQYLNHVTMGATYYSSKSSDGLIVAVMGVNPCYTCGDFDMSEAVNILDITAFINYLYKDGPGPFDIFAVDVDSSGTLNLLDVTAIINFLYRGGPDLNCP